MGDRHWANPEHNVHELICERWSPCIFEDRGIDDVEKIYSCFEAARWAPSCYNDQPWDYIIGIKGKGESWEKIFSTLVEPNQQWAQNASVLAISVAHTKFRERDRPNAHGHHDLGAASVLLCLQATYLGLFAHQMAGFDADKARDLLGIPDHCDPVAAIAIGYRGRTEGAPENLVERDSGPRERRPIEQFVHEGSWKGGLPQ